MYDSLYTRLDSGLKTLNRHWMRRRNSGRVNTSTHECVIGREPMGSSAISTVVMIEQNGQE